jgi:hypothetical protein
VVRLAVVELDLEKLVLVVLLVTVVPLFGVLLVADVLVRVVLRASDVLGWVVVLA